MQLDMLRSQVVLDRASYKRACGDGRCSDETRRRRFELIGSAEAMLEMHEEEAVEMAERTVKEWTES